MRYTMWTIQHEEAFKAFQRTGILRANNDYLFCEDTGYIVGNST